uniref:ORF2 n=1 Tax=Panagrellus redivivus TaxID=6233 RepID=A0A7E4UTT4_PANRE
MTELKTHLLFETLDIAFKKMVQKVDPSCREVRNWQFSKAKDLCALAISSAHGYRIVAYALKHFATRISIVGGIMLCDTVVSIPTYQRLCFKPKYHIRALLHLAGRFCTYIDYTFGPANDDFLEPFYEGLAFNDVLSVSCIRDNPKLFRAYIKGRVFVNLGDYISLGQSGFDYLKAVGNAIVRSFKVFHINYPNSPGTYASLKGRRINDFWIWRHATDKCVNRDIFYGATPQMAYMKRLVIDTKLGIKPAIQMLQRYDVDYIALNTVCLVRTRISFVELVKSWRDTLLTLWSAINNNKGTHTSVHCSVHDRFRDISLNSMVKHLNELLPDYEVICTDHIECKYSNIVGTKSMHVLLVIYTF